MLFLTLAAGWVFLIQAVEAVLTTVTAVPVHILLTDTAPRYGVTQAAVQGAGPVTVASCRRE